MVESFLKKVYFYVKKIFTETENPLYKTFYEDETKGFDAFKSHVESDYTLFWIYKRDSFTDEEIKLTASEIMRRINRLYYMSRQ